MLAMIKEYNNNIKFIIIHCCICQGEFNSSNIDLTHYDEIKLINNYYRESSYSFKDIKFSSKVKKLYLKYYTIFDLADFIRDNLFITYFDIDKCEIINWNTLNNITFLKLKNTNITNDDLIHLKNIESLYLDSNNDLTDINIFNNKDFSLKKLFLSGNLNLKNLSGCENIEQLYIYGCVFSSNNYILPIFYNKVLDLSFSVFFKNDYSYQSYFVGVGTLILSSCVNVDEVVKPLCYINTDDFNRCWDSIPTIKHLDISYTDSTSFDKLSIENIKYLGIKKEIFMYSNIQGLKEKVNFEYTIK